MTSQVVLNNVKSTQANPMGYWTVTLTPSNRTANSITIKCDATCTLNSSSSSTQMGVTCSIYLGGSWYDFVMVPYGTWWTGNAPKTASTTVTISGLSASQTSITGIQFKAWAGDGEGPGISATSCSNLSIDSHDGSVPDASVPQVVLSNSQSSLSSPYGFWTVTLTPRNRTTNSVVIDCEMSCSLQYSGSYTGYRVTCGMYLGGAWHDVEINPSGNGWSGTSPRTARMTVTVSGLTASQTSITGIYFRAAAADGWGPGTADKACANLNIPSANAASTWSLSSSSINIGGSFSASITPVISTNYHTFKLASGSNSTSFGNYTTSASIAATADVVGYWFGGSATSLSGTLTMYTYDSSGTYLGESSKTVTISMTSAAGTPTGLSVSHYSTSKGSVVFTFVAPNAKYNASISSYSVSSNIGTASRSGTTVTVSIPSGASTSSVTLTVTAKDSRGYTTSASGSASYNGQSTFSLNTSSINLGGSLTVSVDEWVASNTYTLSANGVTFVSKGTGSSTSCTFSAANFGSLFAASSKTASVTLACTTYNSSGTSLGTTNKTVTLNMTEALGAPTGLAISTSKVEKGMITFAVLPPSTKYGATISGYKATTNVGTISVSGITAVAVIPSGANTSTVNISITATDSRGYTVTASHSEDYNGGSIFNFSTTDVSLADAATVSVDEWVASNTYTLTANGVTFVSKGTSNSTICTFKPSDFGSLFASDSTVASTVMNCTTYDSSGTQITNSSTKTINLTMPSSVGAPTGMKLTITSATNTEIVATITAPSTKYGATISDYVVSTNKGTATRNGNTITVSNPSGFGTGKVQISAYAVDSRGFNSNTAIVEKLTTTPKILLNGASYEKVISHNKNVVAIYSGSTRIM